MGKFYGNVGYAVTRETAPGVWTEVITERPYYGEVIKLGRKLINAQQVNDNVEITNSISIISDPFAMNHFQSIRYVEWLGAKWKVSSVEEAFPRLTLTLGGIYNEQTTS